MGRKSRVTIIDIAEETGLSKTTVSRVIAGETGVAPATRRAVLEAAARLGYRPNQAARALRTDRSALVGFAVPCLNEVFSAQAERLSALMRSNGVDVIIGTSSWHPEEDRGVIESMLDRGVDALVVSLSDDTDRESGALLQSLTVPVALLDREVKGVTCDSVLTDQGPGIRQAVTRLTELGHRRIGLVTTGQRTRPGREVEASWRAAMSALPSSGLDLAQLVEYEALPLSDSSGQGALRLIDRGATALLVCAPVAAMAATLHALADSGVRVPEDLSLVTYHEHELASAKHPRLAAITRPFADMGDAAGRLILGRLSNQSSRPRVEVITTGFSEGESLGPVS